MTLTEVCDSRINLADYYDWLEAAEPGDRIVYHVGDLQFDRDKTNYPTAGKEIQPQIDALNTLANRVLADARLGAVNVFQRKLALNISEYIAEAREKIILSGGKRANITA